MKKIQVCLPIVLGVWAESIIDQQSAEIKIVSRFYGQNVVLGNFRINYFDHTFSYSIYTMASMYQMLANLTNPDFVGFSEDVKIGRNGRYEDLAAVALTPLADAWAEFSISANMLTNVDPNLPENYPQFNRRMSYPQSLLAFEDFLTGVVYAEEAEDEEVVEDADPTMYDRDDDDYVEVIDVDQEMDNQRDPEDLSNREIDKARERFKQQNEDNQ